MSQRNYEKNTINLRQINNDYKQSARFYRQRKQLPRKPYYEKDEAHASVMMQKRYVEENDVAVARHLKMPQFELVINGVTVDFSRRRGPIYAQLERKKQGHIFHVFPNGMKRIVATRKGGETIFYN